MLTCISARHNTRFEDGLYVLVIRYVHLLCLHILSTQSFDSFSLLRLIRIVAMNPFLAPENSSAGSSSHFSIT